MGAGSRSGTDRRRRSAWTLNVTFCSPIKAHGAQILPIIIIINPCTRHKRVGKCRIPPTSWSVQEMLGERRHPVQSRSRKREREGGRRGSSATFRLRKIPAKYPPPPLPTTEVPSRFPQTSRNDGYSLCWAYSNSWRQPEDCRCGEDWGETAVVAILLLLSSPSVRAASLHN